MSLLLHNADALVAFMAAVSVFFSCIVVAWPYLYKDVLGERMRQVAEERAALRIRERHRLNDHRRRGSLRPEPKILFKEIFTRLNLEKQAEDSELINRLSMAGYRGRARIITYLAARILTPGVAFCVALLYTFVLLHWEQPFAIKLIVCVIVAGLGYYAPAVFIKNMITKRQGSIKRAWPDALDLMLICVDSGMSVEGALRKVADEIGPQSAELAEEMSLTTAELSYLPDRRRAYSNLADRTGLDHVRGVATGLIQAEQYGTSVGQVLRVLAQESRDVRMSLAEKKAHSLPPKLTVPMIVFFLPVLFAIIITPAIVQAMSQ